jgi:hypothetical protein
MRVGTLAAVSMTAALVVSTLVLVRAAHLAHTEWLLARSRAARSLGLGDRRGHAAAQNQSVLLRRQVRGRVRAMLATTVLLVVVAVLVTVVA